jgi:hypothetical protein
MIRFIFPDVRSNALETIGSRFLQFESYPIASVPEFRESRLLSILVASQGNGHVHDANADFTHKSKGKPPDNAFVIGVR